MELRHLRYFLAAGEALNFTKAAARLRVTPPALSLELLRTYPLCVGLTATHPFYSSEIRSLGEGRRRTTHRTLPQGIPRVSS
jgi:hypothetical protein